MKIHYIKRESFSPSNEGIKRNQKTYNRFSGQERLHKRPFLIIGWFIYIKSLVQLLFQLYIKMIALRMLREKKNIQKNKSNQE